MQIVGFIIVIEALRALCAEELRAICVRFQDSRAAQVFACRPNVGRNST
jgi:hypothetical protein